MFKHMGYDGEERTSFVADSIGALAKIVAGITFFALWPGGPFDFVLKFLEGQLGIPWIVSWFCVPVVVWIVMLMIGYSFRQFTAFMAGKILPALAVATAGVIGLWLEATPTLTKISGTFGITAGQLLAAIWAILFFGVMMAVAYFFRSRGYHYD